MGVMAFWIAAALLTLLATALVVLPLLRGKRGGASALDHDRALYHARLSEIDADLKLGRIDAAEAEAAKAEEGRKLIALSASQKTDSSGAGACMPRFALAATVIFVPLAALAFYIIAGVPNMPDMALASRPDRDLSAQSITQLLERAEAQLARNPDDSRGWRVVAPVYMRLGRTQDAVTAWRNAARLEPDNVELKTSLAEAMTVAASGVVTEEARTIFSQALEKSPGNAKARFYLAIALGQQGANAEAAEAWRALIAEAPADAPWLEVARAQLRAVSGETTEAPATAQGKAAPGPSQEDVAAASQMSPEDRQVMIESMVSGLAERLKDNPGDKQGWQRLVRAYAVLGQKDKAKQAVEDARGAFPDDTEFLAALETMVEAVPAREGIQ